MQELVARLHVLLEVLDLPLAPPPHTDLDSVPLELLLPARHREGSGPRSFQTLQTTSNYEAELQGGELANEYVPLDESASWDADVVVEESSGPKRKAAGTAGGSGSRGRSGGSGIAGGSARGVAKHGGKKMTVKNRLMKKLGL